MKSKVLVIFNLINIALFISFQQGCASLPTVHSERPLLTLKDLKRNNMKRAIVQRRPQAASLGFQVALPSDRGDVEYQIHTEAEFAGHLEANNTLMLVALSRESDQSLAVHVYQPSDLLTICLDCQNAPE